ncbi:MAG TPA: YdeI/OmpD-associated family protein [Actinomycetota bacterium]|nr:YdeI/OmpD-associated family protein [Actinomycetota bacterium]
MEPTFFATPDEFRAWLEENHLTARELLVGFYKKGSGRPSITWPESVDQALCFGWIDGVRRSLDAESYTIRFTPRKPGSIWSAVNIRKVQELTKAGLMRPAGLEAFARRDEAKSAIYSYEQRNVAAFSDAQLARFQADPAAWEFFESQPASYRKAATWWVTSAKRDDTKERRLASLIEHSSAGRTVPALTPPQKR